MSSLPIFAIPDTTTTAQDAQKIKTYMIDFETNDFVTKDGKLVEVEGKEAIKSFVWHVLKTTRGVPAVHVRPNEISEEKYFGINYELYFNKVLPQSFLEIEFTREVVDQLVAHPNIKDVTDINILKKGRKVTFNATIVTTLGLIQIESMEV